MFLIILFFQAYVHPVKVALTLKKEPRLLSHWDQIVNVLELMSEKEMKRGMETNEVMSFKLHYYKCIVSEIAKYVTSLTGIFF